MILVDPVDVPAKRRESEDSLKCAALSLALVREKRALDAMQSTRNLYLSLFQPATEKIVLEQPCKHVVTELSAVRHCCFFERLRYHVRPMFPAMSAINTDRAHRPSYDSALPVASSRLSRTSSENRRFCGKRSP